MSPSQTGLEHSNVHIVQAATTLAEPPSLFFSCGTVPDTLSYAPPAAPSFMPALLACICIFQFSTAEDALQLRDAAAQFSQAQHVVASNGSWWLQTGISVAAAAAIVLCMLLLKGPRATAGAVNNPSYRRQLHLSMLLCASIVLLMRPAAAATSAATICSAITPVCFKASSSSTATSTALPALDSRPKTPAAPRPTSTPVTNQRPSAQASDVPSPSATTQDAPASSRPAAPAWPAPVPVQQPAASSGYDALLAAMGAQLLDQLLATLLAPQPQKRPPPPPPPPAPSPAPTPIQPPVEPRPPWSPRPAVPPAGGLLFLNSSQLRVAVDTRRGGAISHLSSPLLPGPWTNTNLINTWDSGRLVQQSYYGCPDGSCWSDRPWRFNPVQEEGVGDRSSVAIPVAVNVLDDVCFTGSSLLIFSLSGGSWQNLSPKLLSVDAQGSSITTTSIPRNWGGQQLVEDAVMTSSVSLDNNLVKVTFNMRYTGSATHPAHHQELPAVFVSRRLNVLALYTGSAPWTDQPVSFQLPGQLGQYYKLPERWAAYIDAATGIGIGVYNPYATDLVAYRIGPDNSGAKSDCSYFAPLVTAAIQPDTDFTYDVYITVGGLDDMRKRFKAIAATVQPNLALQRRRVPLEVDGLLQGSPIQASFEQRYVTAGTVSPIQEEQAARYSSAQAGGPDKRNRQVTEGIDKDYEKGDNVLFQDPDQQILSAAEGSSQEGGWWPTAALPTASLKHLLHFMASVLSAAAQLSKEMLLVNVRADPALPTD
eukprot:gene5646-5885_t